MNSEEMSSKIVESLKGDAMNHYSTMANDHCATVCELATADRVQLWLDPIPDSLRAEAVAAIERGDCLGFLIKADNVYALDLVYFNARAFQALGIYEPALLHAFTVTRTNNRRWPLRELKAMFDEADRGRLRAAGSPLPSKGPYTLYRGVAGHGAQRRIRGFSWTCCFDRAAWFARRFATFLHDPAVYRVTVSEDDVLAYIDDRNEQEFIVSLPLSARPIRESRFGFID
jgi:hypothetical protein